ncbi:MAG: hypothetical protein CMQ24_16505 [Gammaproteobacteria bacterium]|nr:hypothetical protein [Gammaproteobacteria bacterium]
MDSPPTEPCQSRFQSAGAKKHGLAGRREAQRIQHHSTILHQHRQLQTPPLHFRTDRPEFVAELGIQEEHLHAMIAVSLAELPSLRQRIQTLRARGIERDQHHVIEMLQSPDS